MRKTTPKTKTNRRDKENTDRRDSKKLLMETVKCPRRNSESVGKIVKNRSRASCHVLADVTPSKNIPTVVCPKGSNSAMKKKKLEEMYKCMVEQYETKQKQLDDRMLLFETSHPVVKKGAPYQYQRQQLPILATSEFKIPQFNPTQKLRIQQLETCKVITKQPTKHFVPRRHETEQCQPHSDSGDSCEPLQLTEPEQPPRGIFEDASVRKFTNLIGKQIDLEAELRKWRNRVNKKLQPTILQSIEQEGIPKDILKVDFQQYQVFGRDSVTTPEIISTNIVRCYKLCEQHWEKSVKRQFTQSQLKIILARLDFDTAGVVTPKVLARQLSIIMNKNYRVRDVYRVTKRISPELNITLDSMVRSLRAAV